MADDHASDHALDHAPPARGERLEVRPPLAPDDVVFLAGFGRHPVHDHAGERLGLPARVPRIWPGQPAGACPWVPCAHGCCLRLGGRTGVAAAAAWLRFLLAEFLDATHELDGTVEVPGPGRARAVLIVDRTDVFEGELDTGGDGPDGRDQDREPWSG